MFYTLRKKLEKILHRTTFTHTLIFNTLVHVILFQDIFHTTLKLLKVTTVTLPFTCERKLIEAFKAYESIS